MPLRRAPEVIQTEIEMSDVAAAPIEIAEEQKEQYRKEGYMILERAIPDEHLHLLREECRYFVDRQDATMAQAGKDTDGFNYRGKRYFIPLRWSESRRLHQFLFSELMAQICRATIGDEAYLFWEQWVVKHSEVGMEFAWHQDSAYVPYPHKRYVTVWCALDDMSEENGTLYILPFSRAGTQEVQLHVHDPKTNDLAGYHGGDRGVAVLVPAGSVAVFSSVTFHCSGANKTDRMRRVYAPTYSCEPMLDPQPERQRGLQVPFLKGGRNVFQLNSPSLSAASTGE